MSYIIFCPNCNNYVEIEQINCGIFRHAVIKSNGIQVDPHLDKETLDILIKTDRIYGCGKPFQIIKNTDNSLTINICDYI